jgi:hypothetical protein
MVNKYGAITGMIIDRASRVVYTALLDSLKKTVTFSVQLLTSGEKQ